MPTLYLVRHPRLAHATGLCYGRLDLPLAEAPHLAADRLRSQLPTPLGWVYTSPLRRCRELAAALSSAPRVDARLLEMNFGAWEGRPWSAIGIAAIDAWTKNPGGFRPPGGESAQEVQQRALEWIADLRQRHRETEEIVCIAHGGILRVLAAWQQKLPPERWCDLKFDYETVLKLKVP